jgi:K+-sensing histidine kinase KdpD
MTDDTGEAAPTTTEALRNTGEDPEVILVAVDTSTGSNRVLANGARLARAFPGAALHVVHVFRTSRFDRAHAGAPTPSPTPRSTSSFTCVRRGCSAGTT